MSQAVLFLDVDGVLNAAVTIRNHKVMGISPENLHHHLDPDMVARLERVLVATGAVIVLSSSWRYSNTPAQMTARLRASGAPSANVIDRTATWHERKREIEDAPHGVWILGGERRGTEIEAWLMTHPEVDRFAIVDDDSDMEPYMDKLVLTTWQHGLQDEHGEALVGLLGER